MLEVASEVARAVAESRAVVALESSVFCHGIPPPENVSLAVAVERMVREAGAVPATIAVMDGRVRVGLSEDELRRLATAPRVAKCTTRDLPLIVAQGGLGATTVAATAFLAARLGLDVMATGGLGGVHRGGELSMDVSADLEELARSAVAVVCSGIKAILDLERTLERLESLGVPVVGFRCSELPGFYTAETGLPIPRIDDLDGLCRMLRAHHELGLPAGIVVAQPPPAERAMRRDALDQLVARAREAASRAGVRGPQETPFLLRRMAELSGGATVRLNGDLLLANARLAGQLAVALAQAKTHKGLDLPALIDTSRTQ